MNNNIQEQNPFETPSQPEFTDRREARHQRIQERRETRAGRVGGAWLGGVLLIAIGMLFLLQNLQILSFGNWWALFLMLPALSAFGSAWRAFQDAGNRLDASARGSTFVGLIFTALTVFFLFELDLTILGPALIILVGLGLIVNAVLPK